MKAKHYHLPILLLLLDSTPQNFGQSVSDQCYSLSSSKYCGGSYGSYYLSTNTVIEGIPVTDVVSLDRAIDYYFGSPQDIRTCSTYFRCNPMSTWDGVYFPPFRELFYCRQLLENPFSMACNSKNPVPPTCQADCLQSVDEWQFLWGNDTLCNSPGDLASKRAAIVQGWCDVSPYNGTQANCIQPKDTPQTVCGYSLPQDLPSLCIYCTGSPQAPCCNSDHVRSCKNSENNSKSQLIIILPIVVGCLGMIGLVAGVWLYYKKKRQHGNTRESAKDPNPGTFTGPNPRSSTMDSEYITPFSTVYTCVYPYEPTLPDELRILPGDAVTILMTFEDDWGVGRNLTRGGEGALPLACLDKGVTPSEETIVSISSSSSIPRRTCSKRDSGNIRISQYSTKST
ncbi:hypothetical protein K7432_002972 [Basidiobolus ranarum]|uniref:SH3 domain-containing protein n=1 Tax=Basidiobolus ranarum TaxID=34480 RepID=A0ABR2W6Y3_9FUNG